MRMRSLLGINLRKYEKILLNWSWLILRIAIAALMLRHGFGKLMGFEKMAAHFPDPLGVGSNISLMLVIGSEFFASVFLLAGLLVRWASFTTLVTMLVAAFVIHGADPFDKQELAVLYAVVYLFFVLAGGGKYSLDNYLKYKLKRKI